MVWSTYSQDPPKPTPKVSLINNNLTIYNITKYGFYHFHLQAKCHYSKYPIPWLWCIFCYIPVSNNLRLQIMMHIDLHCSSIWIVRLYIEILPIICHKSLPDDKDVLLLQWYLIRAVWGRCAWYDYGGVGGEFRRGDTWAFGHWWKGRIGWVVVSVIHHLPLLCDHVHHEDVLVTVLLNPLSLNNIWLMHINFVMWTWLIFLTCQKMERKQ